MENVTTPLLENTVNKEQILHWYMNDILEGNEPKNVYLFSKNHGIDEQIFYQFYNGFDGIENHFFELIFDKTYETMLHTEAYLNYPPKEKLLSLYYTFFGNLTQNRSFVMYLLKNIKIENLKKLSGLRKKFIAFVSTLEIDKLNLRQKDLNKLQDRAMEEAAWLQFLSVLKFWINDKSAGFEKTDIFIEKSLTAGFDLINTSPLKSVADLGKFIYKEFRS